MCAAKPQLVPLLLLCAGIATPAGADLVAERITPENVARLQIGGVHSVGGVGDWALGNGTICGVIAGARHETVISEYGAVPVDLGHCGRDDDQLAYWEVIVGVPAPTVRDVLTRPLEVAAEATLGDEADTASDVAEFVEAHRGPVPRLRAEVADGEARVIATAQYDGVRAEIRYAVGRAEPRVLRITTRLERVEKGRKVSMFGRTILHGNGSLRPFTLSTRPGEGGFRYPPVDPDDPLSMARAMRPAKFFALVGGAAVEPGIAYGVEVREAVLERSDGSRRDLPLALVTGGHFTLMMVLMQPLWLGSPERMGLLELAQLPFMDVAVGDAVRIESAVYVGARSDVASVTDPFFARGPTAAPFVSGRVDDPEVRLHVRDDQDRAVTVSRPRPDGRFRFRLPSGRHHLEVRSPGGTAHARTLEIGVDDVDLGRLPVGNTGRVRLPRAGPMRLVFQGVEGTPDPVLGDDLLGLRFGGEPYPLATSSNDVSLAGVPGDPAHVTLAPGTYRVLATRGPEFSVGRTRVEVAAGETTDLVIEPPVRVLETPGWIAADLHVHGAASFDSGLPWPRQLAAFAAQGGEVLLASDHHVITDLRPVIAQAGLTGRVAGITGTEVTGTAESPAAPFTIGHANAFPLVPEPHAYRAGGPASANRRLRDVMATLRAKDPEVVVQLNHPRSAPGESPPSPFYYLDHKAVAGRPFRASAPLRSEHNRALVERDPATGVRDLDFDAMEIWNGASRLRYLWTRAAWFSLLLQGERRTGTANSDSHRLGEVVALPRSYVRIADDRVAAFDERAFLAALRAGRVFGTSGPLLDADLGGAGLGERFAGRSGELRLSVTAAPWVPVSEARVWVNAELAWRGPVSAGETLRIPLSFPRDAWLVVEVEGEPDDVFAAVAPGFRSFAFTNPIYVDAEGDGVWRAPGFSRSSPPDALANPSQSDRRSRAASTGRRR